MMSLSSGILLLLFMLADLIQSVPYFTSHVYVKFTLGVHHRRWKLCWLSFSLWFYFPRHRKEPKRNWIQSWVAIVLWSSRIEHPYLTLWLSKKRIALASPSTNSCCPCRYRRRRDWGLLHSQRNRHIWEYLVSYNINITFLYSYSCVLFQGTTS